MTEGAEGQTDSQWGDRCPDVSSECLSLTARKGWLLGTRNRSFRQRALPLLLQGWFSARFVLPSARAFRTWQIPTPVPAPLTPSGAPGRHLNGRLPLRTVPCPQTSPAPRNIPAPTLASGGVAGCRQVHSPLWFGGGTVGSTGFRGRRQAQSHLNTSRKRWFSEALDPQSWRLGCHSPVLGSPNRGASLSNRTHFMSPWGASPGEG